jgi:hypothetical protein
MSQVIGEGIWDLGLRIGKREPPRHAILDFRFWILDWKYPAATAPGFDKNHPALRSGIADFGLRVESWFQLLMGKDLTTKLHEIPRTNTKKGTSIKEGIPAGLQKTGNLLNKIIILLHRLPSH